VLDGLLALDGLRDAGMFLMKDEAFESYCSVKPSSVSSRCCQMRWMRFVVMPV